MDRTFRRGYLCPALFADMLGFGVCKMIRRILGFAHVIDFECTQDAALRADCEAGALAMAHMLLMHPEQFHSVDDVIDAVPRVVRRARKPSASSLEAARHQAAASWSIPAPWRR
jgi:5-methylthioribose kinase